MQQHLCLATFFAYVTSWSLHDALHQHKMHKRQMEGAEILQGSAPKYRMVDHAFGAQQGAHRVLTDQYNRRSRRKKSWEAKPHESRNFALSIPDYKSEMHDIAWEKMKKMSTKEQIQNKICPEIFKSVTRNAGRRVHRRSWSMCTQKKILEQKGLDGLKCYDSDPAGGFLRPVGPFGPYSSGTNFVCSLFKANSLPGCNFCAIKHAPPHDLRSLMYTNSFSVEREWEHPERKWQRGSFIKFAPEESKNNGMKEEAYLYVILVRNPLSQIVSWSKGNYDLACGLRPEDEEFSAQDRPRTNVNCH